MPTITIHKYGYRTELHIHGLGRPNCERKNGHTRITVSDDYGVNVAATGDLDVKSAEFVAGAIQLAAKLHSGEIIIGDIRHED